jgi:hypothetical protein
MALFALGVVGAVSGTGELDYGLVAMVAAYVFTVLARPAARRLPTWFVHAFVLTHLAQMTVFFSHQYGFRLILPMYVAMTPVVGYGVAAIVAPAIRWLVRTAADARRRSASPESRAARPRVVAPLLAVGLCSLALVAGAPSEDRARESFYGLNGDAALAARQAARPDLLRLADAVYFTGDDSRSPAVAYLPGLAYPSLRWFDGARGLVLPPPSERALYVIADRTGADFARRCLGERTLLARERDGPSGAWLDLLAATRGEAGCASSRVPVGATFDGVARLVGYDAPASIEPGQRLDVVMRWEALARPRERARPFVRLVDAKGRRWGHGEAGVYPSSAWRPGEEVLATVSLELDPTLAPSDYGLELGFTAGSGLAQLAEDGPGGARGQFQARSGPVRLVSRSTPLARDGLPITHPVDAAFDGVRLLGASLDRDAVRPGQPARLSLFWQNAAGRLPDAEMAVAIRDASGVVVKEWRGRPVDGTYPTPSWKPGEVVRDTWDVLPPARLAAGPLDLAVGVAPPGQSPGRYVSIAALTILPVSRELAEPNVRTRQEARFGELARLVGFELKNRRLDAGDSVELTLVWQALAESAANYAVSLELVDAAGVALAQHLAEPAGGRRPTAGWLPGEYVEDGHKLRVPRETPRGRYQLVVSVLDAVDGRRLAADNESDRVVLGTEVVVE